MTKAHSFSLLRPALVLCVKRVVVRVLKPWREAAAPVDHLYRT